MRKSLIKSNLLYFDVEYANLKNKSICQMGLMIEDYISKDPTYPEINLYVNPNDEFDPNCSNVHHITKDKVSKEKTFDFLWDDIQKYFVNSVVVGHNVAASDLDALCKNLIRYSIPVPELYFIDTYEIAKDFISTIEVSDYKLSTLCSFFDIDIDSEHDAFDDACACSDLLNELIRNYDVNLQMYVHHYDFNKKDYVFSTYLNKLSVIRETNFLLGKVRGFLADGIIANEEKKMLEKWKNEHQSFIDNQYGNDIVVFIDHILDDGILTTDEVKQLENLLIKKSQDFSSAVETKATQELQGMIEGIVSDNEINKSELLSLEKWMYDNDYLIGHYPYDRIKVAIENVIEDHIITEEEKLYLINLFHELFNPIGETIKNIVLFENKEFCLSGDFSHGSKKDVEQYIIEKGGIVSSNVRKKTDYVVVGEHGASTYSNGNYGTKVKKAMELGIFVITEKQLYCIV